MASEDDAAQSVGQYAFEQYREQGGGAFAGIFTTGLSDIVAATKAIAAANEAKALSADPNTIDATLKKLTEMQDELGGIREMTSLLNTETPLGGGYAEEVGRFNQQFGKQVVEKIIPDVVKALDNLKAEVEKSRDTYQNVDGGQAGTFDNL